VFFKSKGFDNGQMVMDFGLMKEAKYGHVLKNAIHSKDKTANEIKKKYHTTYTKYINAVNRGKNTPAVRKAHAAYMKAKAKFMGLFKK